MYKIGDKVEIDVSRLNREYDMVECDRLDSIIITEIINIRHENNEKIYIFEYEYFEGEQLELTKEYIRRKL